MAKLILAAFCLMIAWPTALAAVPALSDTLVYSVRPWKAQQGQQVMITGVHFGSAPEVRFKDELATIVVYRADMGRIVATVPPGDTDGPLTVTNTGAAQVSNTADFVLLSGSFVEACSIGGDVTDPSAVALPGTVVVALDPLTEEFAGAAVSAAISGSYSLGLATAGDYLLLFIPPAGAPYQPARYLATCGSTQDHQFATGLELSGRVVSDTPAPIANAWVGVEGTGDLGNEMLTDANGDFTFYMPADSYNIEVVGPVGGRHIAVQAGPLAVTVNTDLGDITLDSGVIVSGELAWQDDGDSGPLGGAGLMTFDSFGTPLGMTVSIGDGSFHMATETGTALLLGVSANAYGFGDLAVRAIDVAADMELDYPFTVYSYSGQLPALPTIAETGSMVVLERQRLQFDAVQSLGSTVEIRFSDGMTGWIDGVDTYVAPARGGLVTTVPMGAKSGDVVLSVDGVDGPGYPLTVDPGLFDPGPFTTSGVIKYGMVPVEGAFVGIFEIDCDDEFLVDYAVTGADGAYSVRHAAGDYALFALPPESSELARAQVPLPGVTGGQVRDIPLVDGHTVEARCVDSGVGPVGSTDALPDCEVGFVGTDVDHDDWVHSGDDGAMTMFLPTGNYEIFLHAPVGSRYVNGEGTIVPITGDVDFGDAPLDSGYFIEGRIVDPSGDGLIGVEVNVYDANLGVDAGRMHTVGPDGNFRLAVPAGMYHVFVGVHPDHEYWVPSQFNVLVAQDQLLYPAMQAEVAGHVKGRVLDSLASPVDELPVAAYHDLLGFVRQTDTCPDGSYDLKVPDGNYVIHARPSAEELCLADEYYDNYYEGCGADTVALTAPATVTGIDFTLEPAGSISGSVVGATGPLGNVAVCATNGSTNPVCYQGCVTTAPNGTYLLTNVPVAADFRVDASGPGYAWECWDGYADCTDYDPVAVAECLDTSGIRFHTGAGLAPGPVPDGDHVAGTLMSVGRGVSPGEIVINWQPTCDADDHAIYFGTLRAFDSYTFAACDAGMTGSATLVPPGGDLFWVVVGQGGPLEGSYGVDGTLVERPSDGAAQCGNIQDLGATCVP